MENVYHGVDFHSTKSTIETVSSGANPQERELLTLRTDEFDSKLYPLFSKNSIVCLEALNEAFELSHRLRTTKLMHIPFPQITGQAEC